MAKKPAKPAKEKPPSKRGRQKGQQKHLPGMAPKKDNDIHPVALEYVQARDTRMEYGRSEVELRERLIALLEKKGVSGYEYDDISVVTAKKKVKVKVKKAGKEGNDQE